MDNLEYRIKDKEELAAACLNFCKHGGIFIRTSGVYNLKDILQVTLKIIDEPTALTFIGEVIWIVPKHEQNQMPEGIGLQFSEKEAELICAEINRILPNSFIRKV